MRCSKVSLVIALSGISLSSAADPYEVFCLSEDAFNPTTYALHDCVGTDSQACENAGGNLVEGNCEEINTLTSNACESISGFTYTPKTTCEELTTADLNWDDACLDPVWKMYVIPHVQYTCCGESENHKQICEKSSDAFCLSEDGYNANAYLFHDCVGDDAQACEEAGGTLGERSCGGIDTLTPDACESISGFTYTPIMTCEQAAMYKESVLINICLDPDTSAYVESHILSTCCGATENHGEVCGEGSKSSHEIFCNNAEAFQANTTAIYSCSGTDSDACESAGGSFNGEAEICEDINMLGPNDCEAIPGFTPKTQNTCSDVAIYFQTIDLCEDEAIRSSHYRLQSICCGGDPANFADVCDGDVDVPTKEEVCESCEYELDTLSQKGVTEGCFGKVQTYMQFATVAPNLEGCDDVDGPANVNVVCKNSVMSNFDCDSSDNEGPITAPTREEVCESCEYELDTLSEKGVTEGCYGKVETYMQFATAALNLEGCDDVDDPANVNVVCKNSVLSNFDCDTSDNEGPITAPTREEVCESCVEAMETLSEKGVTQGCFDNVSTYVDVMQTEVAEGCDEDNIKGPADVTPLCKNSTMTYFNCSLDEHDGHDHGVKDDAKENGKTSAAPRTQAAFVGAAVMVISAVLF